MCELFAFSGEHLALLHCSLHEFADHGAGLRNADGWGIAHYIDGDVRLLKEASAARDSACLNFVQSHPLRSDLVMSHIRHAIQGAPTVRNCQPFVRELGGAMHVFAHNGNLDRSDLDRLAMLDGFRPVGETDSELAFCVLLERLRPLRRTWRAAIASWPRLPKRSVHSVRPTSSMRTATHCLRTDTSACTTALASGLPVCMCCVGRAMPASRASHRSPPARWWSPSPAAAVP